MLYCKVSKPYDWMLKCSYCFFFKSICAAEMPVKFQSNWKTRRGLAKNCELCDIESAPRPVQCSANSSLIVLEVNSSVEEVELHHSLTDCEHCISQKFGLATCF